MSYIFDILLGICGILHTILATYMWIVIISALLTWVNPDPYNPIIRLLRNMTEPLLFWVRRRLPFVVFFGGDLSPVVVVIGLQLLDSMLSLLLTRIAMHFVGT